MHYDGLHRGLANGNRSEWKSLKQRVASAYLRVPKMRAEIVALRAELERDDFVHDAGNLVMEEVGRTMTGKQQRWFRL
jgi:hypothetical protein